MYRLTGSTLQSTGGFEDHAEHTKVCLERICASYDPDCGDRGTLSYYGRRLVEAGLLREYYDEQSGQMRIDADGVMMDRVMVQSSRVQRTLLICMHRWERPRMRCRRLHVYSTDPKRPQGDLFGRD